MSYYSSNEKSLYNLYVNYDKTLIDFVLNTFAKEYKTLLLVKKRYGNNYDGVGATTLISYMDEQKIKTFLMRFEQRLKAIKILLEQGKTFEDISLMFEEKNEVEVARITNNILNTLKSKTTQEVFKTLDEIISKYKTSIDELNAALKLMKDSNKRLCYMYTYGINQEQMSRTMICKLLAINTKQYDRYILETQKSIPVLLTRLKQKKMAKEENSLVNENVDTKLPIKTIENVQIKDIPMDLHKINIYELIPNAHLIMDNPLCNIDIVDIPNIDEIVSLYSICKDSNELLSKINIDSNRLIMIYISNLDKFNDISEIVNYIIMHADINMIMLLTDKLFNNNLITLIEKELIYLKFLQIKDKNITNSIISLITGLSIEDITGYRIMTNNDKINTINKLL